MSATKVVSRIALGSFLGGWFGLSILQQMDRTELTKRVDPTSLLVPNWRFFAPLPARHDYNVLFRGRDASGVIEEWQEESFSVPRSIEHLLWHPVRRTEKAIFDVASELFRISEELTDPRAIQMSVSYLSLLNYLSRSVEHPHDRLDIQFLLARSTMHEPEIDPQLLFLSEWHRLPTRKNDPEKS